MMFPYLCLSTPVLIIMLPNSGSVSLHLFENPVGCLSEKTLHYAEVEKRG